MAWSEWGNWQAGWKQLFCFGPANIYVRPGVKKMDFPHFVSSVLPGQRVDKRGSCFVLVALVVAPAKL